MSRILILCCFLVLTCTKLKSQDAFGFSNSNYSPTTTVFHNPTSIVDSKVWLDLHIIGAGAFAYNNFAYAQGSIFIPKSYDPHSYNLSDKNKDAYVNLSAQIISASFQYKEHGFAFTSRVRNLVDARKIPSEFARLMTTDIDNSALINQDVNVTNLYLAEMSFAEFGFTYANAIYHFAKDLLVVGGSFKYNIGILGGGLQVDELRYRVNENSQSLFFKFDAEYGYAAGWKSGSGFGLDGGITYKKMLDNVTFYDPFSRKKSCDHYLYKYKIGASLIDFGYVNYNKDATYQRFEIESDAEISDFKPEDLAPQNIEEFTTNNFTNGLQVTNATKFKLWLPFALNVQFDYNFENNVFLAAQYMQGWPKRIYLGIERPTVLSVSPRYETKWFESTLNVSSYNWEEIRVGAMFRIGSIAFGTDKLGSMFGFTNKSYGADFYIHFKYHFWTKPGCKRKKKKRKRNESQCVKFK